MPPPLSIEELLKLIRQSGVVDESALMSFLDARRVDETAEAHSLIEEMVQNGVLTNFQAEQFVLGKWRGFTIGRYKFLERIGVGGMGQVFLCEHLHMKRRVAIKVLPPAKAEQPAALGRFYREARAAATLRHPNVVRTHDIDQDGELHFIVMDYIAGTNLLDIVKRFGPLDIGRATQYVVHIALALDFAFRNKIIHRDVKPGNIMIDREGVARLLDLGLARFLNDHGDQLTLKYDDKIVLGTADYVAPEQIENSHAVDTRADIYALGSTFYFLLAGHPPFPTGSVSQKLLWHRTKPPTRIRELRPEVPVEMATVLDRMMAKDPKDRCQTPAQLLTELERLLPAFVPPPRAEEMPILSPAARVEMPESTKVIEEGKPELAIPEPETLSANSYLTPPRIDAQVKEQSRGTQVSSLSSGAPVPHLADAETGISAALLQTPTPNHRSKHAKPVQKPSAPLATTRRFPWGLVGALIVAALVGVVLIVG